MASVGLEELITKSEKEYEELAIKIAVEKNFYKEIRNKLKKNIIDAPLFNSKLFTKKIEEAYQIVCKNYKDNKKSEIIEIK